MSTLIIGKTLSNALTQLNNLYQRYREYGIKIIDSKAFTGAIVVEFSNKEEVLITSYSHLQQSHNGKRFKNIYFDKELPQKEFFDFIQPYTNSPNSMWQF